MFQYTYITDEQKETSKKFLFEGVVSFTVFQFTYDIYLLKKIYHQ